MHSRLTGIIAGASIACASVALGAEVTVQNDSLTDGSQAFVCPCFVAGEEAAVWLTSPCDGNIVAFQIFWRSQFGGAQQTIEDSIRVYEAGAFPTPGPEIDVLDAPVMTDGVLNEYRFRDQNQTIPISIPVTSGQQFVVSLRFFNTNSGNPFAPSIVADQDGCQAGKNAIFASPGGWINACAAGVSGDWVIRVIIDCGASGACCLPDGSCADGMTALDCFNAGGLYKGDGSSCATEACVGACCLPGGCLDLTKAQCDIASGAWQGPLSACSTNPCLCDGDADGNGVVDVADVSYVIFRLGNTGAPGTVDGDADGHGTVDVGDISYVIFRFGSC